MIKFKIIYTCTPLTNATPKFCKRFIMYKIINFHILVCDNHVQHLKCISVYLTMAIFSEYKKNIFFFLAYSFKEGGYTIMAGHLPINNASPPLTVISDIQLSFSLNVAMHQASHGNEIKDIFGQYLWVQVFTVTFVCHLRWSQSDWIVFPMICSLTAVQSCCRRRLCKLIL